jgi:hypothetical protein
MVMKRVFGLFVGIFCMFFLTAFAPICNASGAALSIESVNLQLIETREVGNRIIRVYDVIAVLHNTGDVQSDAITVYFSDPEYNTTTPSLQLTPYNISIDPNENITFTFQDWPTPLTGDIPINISFRPSATDVLAIKDINYGYYIQTLHIENNEDTTKGTPGFEVVMVLGAILVLLLIRIRRK